ncbi:hypothetical protein CPB84DRAFT_1965420 [Gymnopilus junonius]|uniref:Uncharacterized protein n=1 Tax=Gymnopilus junonius TaxID=109634 RepID=A0A9P5NEM0_GYMJU|nr:hypothetical protein CPB84DRAFT_1965420 [Gymnopilus junonius]
MSLDVSSNWHSIRPWAPNLSLNVREITSVSATFILSSAFRGDIDSSLAEIGLEAAAQAHQEGPQETGTPNGNGVSLPPVDTKPNSVIADALAKGLSVNVNGSAWPRAFVRIDDQLDEAVIIIYALMPGRQYDIELALASLGQPSTPIRRQVTTEDDSDQDTAEINTDPESPTPDNSTSSDPHSTPSTSPSRTVPGTPPHATPQITLEDRLNQLQHTLSAVNAEREALLTSLKSARRDSQKADSALRSEIDTLKRASEKNAAAELRGKQKVLALQEAVKRAQNSTREMEEMTEEMEGVIPELKTQREQRESEHTKIKSEADRVRKEREDLEEKDRKRLESMKSELSSLTNKLEKLGGKRDKLETTVIPDLEEKLKGVSKEIETEEQGLNKLEEEERQAHLQAELQRTMNGHMQPPMVDDNPPVYVPSQRPRYHSQGEKQGRPAPAPIQRPHADHSGSSSGGSNATQSASGPTLWNTSPTAHRQQSHPQPLHHAQNLTHSPRSHSFHTSASAGHQIHSTPIILTNTQRKSSVKSNNATTISGPSIPMASPANTSSNSTTTSSPTSSSFTSSPTRISPGVSAATSTLSSRAPAFEPSRPLPSLKNANGSNAFQKSNATGPISAFASSGPAMMSVQRPAGAFVGNGRPTAVGGPKSATHTHPSWS